jgi:hypothetical protein
VVALGGAAVVTCTVGVGNQDGTVDGGGGARRRSGGIPQTKVGECTSIVIL